MHYTLKDIINAFEGKTLARAQDIVRRGLVLSTEQIGDVIEGSVQGSADWSYEQDIELYASKHGVEFEGSCSCPVGTMCKHMAAVLLTCLQQEDVAPLAGSVGGEAGAMMLPHAVAAWLQRVEETAHGLAAPARPGIKSGMPAKTTHRLLFVLSPDRSGKHVVLNLCKARLRVNGEIAAATMVGEVYSILANPPSYLQAGDEDVLRLFVALRSGFYGGNDVEPKGRVGAQLLQMLLESQQLQWANSLADILKGQVYQVKAGPVCSAELAWLDEDGRSRLSWQFQPGQDGPAEPQRGSIDYILPTEPVMYVNNLVCGNLILHQGGAGIPLRELQAMVAQAPTLSARDKSAVSHVLLAQGLQHIVPMPQQLQETMRDDIAPQPYLLLGALPQEQYGKAAGSQADWQDFVLPAFDYDGVRVADDHAGLVIRRGGHGIEKIVRQRAAEDAAIAVLQAAGLVPPQHAEPPLSTLIGALVMPTQAEWLRFTGEVVPALEAQGWRIERTADYRYDVAEVEDWYADIDDKTSEFDNPAGSPWFDLELGIVVNQLRVSLLPVLVDLIRNAPLDFNPQALAAHADDEPLLATLPDGVRVALPWGRIKPILGTLGELYFTDKTGGSMRFSTLDAARLAELAGATELRWIGGQRLRDMGQKLATFGGVQSVAAPRGLQATLRDYQSEGLAWMQFLREYDLAGILADDMGLGKTVQTLAHILTEKESGRLTQPALVVAPTSLMGNWQDEAARFAPDLRVLVLQGKERLAHFDAIDQFDLVLTTYALLPRDEEKLREHAYHLVILDESHYIKNPRSKAAQTAGLLRARHRLCLTGTPLENHLGELWSQFHFLLPGLLGEEKVFNTAFRHPIEKQGDDGRRALLTRRIKPFLLRRTKDKVAKELPAKTEMVRSVELSGAQRDLYETVRLAMDKKVRSEIARKGVARSQIVILEALLKLRQVCCDPRLVKSESAKKAAAPSAKLSELMTMVDELLDERRKILVFSSFTSMLALIEVELQARKVPYALLTGATENRADVVRAFQQGLVPIFLISLKAGGVGLNLTAADTVIHYDPWWNPAAENQATDRAWRIGQDKPVFVYKLIAKGTLEEKIQALQQKKADLAYAMLANDGEAQNTRITQEDLQAIFAPLEG